MTCCNSLSQAVNEGHLDCIRYLYPNVHLDASVGARLAIEIGRTDAIVLLHTLGRSWGKSDRYTAVRYGRTDIYKYLCEHGCPGDLKSECEQAVSFGALECLRHIHSLGYRFENTDLCEDAAAKGHLDCLKYLHENGCPWDNRVCRSVARLGRLDCLQYLHENGCALDTRVSVAAALGGHEHILKYIHSRNGPWDEHAVISAVSGGHLACLKYLHEHGCPWNAQACVTAAENGKDVCLKYLHENGCEVGEYTILIAANKFRSSHFSAVAQQYYHCLKYLVQNQCPWKENFSQLAISKCPLVNYAMDHFAHDDYAFVQNVLKDRTWFQVYQLKIGEPLTKHNLHIIHKVRRIQREWLRYSYNPVNLVGHNRMITTMKTFTPPSHIKIA